MPGVHASKKENKTGMRCSDTSSLVMENVRVPKRNLIGEEGEGFVQALQILDGGRISIASLAVGTAQGAFEAQFNMHRYVSNSGKPISQQQATQFKISQMAMKIEAARLLTMKAAWLRDNGQPFSKAASMAKLFASETSVQVSEEAVQIHGGYGYIKEYPVENSGAIQNSSLLAKARAKYSVW